MDPDNNLERTAMSSYILPAGLRRKLLAYCGVTMQPSGKTAQPTTATAPPAQTSDAPEQRGRVDVTA